MKDKINYAGQGKIISSLIKGELEYCMNTNYTEGNKVKFKGKFYQVDLPESKKEYTNSISGISPDEYDGIYWAEIK